MRRSSTHRRAVTSRYGPQAPGSSTPSSTGSRTRGLLLAARAVNVPPTPVVTAAGLAPVITDRAPVIVVKDGKTKGNRIPAAHLSGMLASELFLQQFKAVDVVTRVPTYLSDFTLTEPGYNDGGRGERIFYAGEPAAVRRAAMAITAFLDAMPFATSADRTNAVAAALTVTLRTLWAGAKPVVNVTANKSHAGKDTVVMFAAGSGRVTSVSYQKTDWALERSVVGALKQHPDTAVINVENARLGAYRPDEWLSPAAWVKAAAHLGLVKAIVAEADRDSNKGRERGMGVVLTARQDESLTAQTDDDCLTLRLARARRRFEGGAVSTRYRFEVLARAALPADGEGGQSKT